jgi:hypothetical protein
VGGLVEPHQAGLGEELIARVLGDGDPSHDD